MSPDFSELVRQGVVAAGGLQKHLATALGISEQAVSRAVNGKGYPFGPWNCLKLARLIGERGSVVLRAAGKPDLADLWDATAGGHGRGLSPVRRRHLEDLDALSPADRERILGLSRSLAQARRKAAKVPR